MENKEKILIFLSEKDRQFTNTILRYYEGERDINALRIALNELKNEGKIKTDNGFGMRQQSWWLSKNDSKYITATFNPNLRK
jgi:hypothetical protein